MRWQWWWHRWQRWHCHQKLLLRQELVLLPIIVLHNFIWWHLSNYDHWWWYFSIIVLIIWGLWGWKWQKTVRCQTRDVSHVRCESFLSQMFPVHTFAKETPGVATASTQSLAPFIRHRLKGPVIRHNLHSASEKGYISRLAMLINNLMLGAISEQTIEPP